MIKSYNSYNRQVCFKLFSFVYISLRFPETYNRNSSKVRQTYDTCLIEQKNILYSFQATEKPGKQLDELYEAQKYLLEPRYCIVTDTVGTTDLIIIENFHISDRNYIIGK